MSVFYRSLCTRSTVLSLLLTLGLCVLMAYPAHGQERKPHIVYDYQGRRGGRARSPRSWEAASR